MATYIIPKGFHFCSAFCKRFKKLNTDINFFEFELTGDNWYDFKQVKISGKSKIIGRSYGFGVHNNSIRIVFKADKRTNQFHLWWYWYDRGVRKHQYIGKFGVGKYKFLAFMATDNTVCCYLNRLEHDKWVIVDNIYIKFTEKLEETGYYCFPFFGGKDRAYKTFVWHVHFN